MKKMLFVNLREKLDFGNERPYLFMERNKKYFLNCHKYLIVDLLNIFL